MLTLRALTVAVLLASAAPAPARLAFAQAVTEPLFQCDTADASTQLTLCPQLSTQIAATPIPQVFHGHVRTLALHLRSESSRCTWIIRSGADHSQWRCALPAHQQPLRPGRGL